jgi:hypothetical protein
MNNIYAVQLFVKLCLCYLEHLDSLGFRHANRLKSWVVGYTCYRSKGKDKTVPVHSGKPFAGAELQHNSFLTTAIDAGRVRFKRDGTSAKTRFRLSEKRTSPFESAGVST